jgi:hypothetical protein
VKVGWENQKVDANSIQRNKVNKQKSAAENIPKPLERFAINESIQS